MARAVRFDQDKLKAVILHTASKCGQSQLGAVKLHKVLYFSDMIQYAVSGEPITGATYRKRPFGPTCEQLMPTIRDLERSGEVAVETVDYFGYRKKEYIAKQVRDAGALSNIEVSLLDEVIEFVCFNNTAKTISEFSHARPWEMVDFGDVIPYHSSLSLIPTQVSPEAHQLASQERVAFENQRSSKNAVDFALYANLRSGILQTRA